MNIIKRGETRIVILMRSCVVKLPHFRTGRRAFINGLSANKKERDVYLQNKQSDLLCPVLWCSWLGLILVMPKADTKKHLDEVPETSRAEEDFRRYRKWIESGLAGDDKSENYGYLSDKLVKLDYGF